MTFDLARKDTVCALATASAPAAIAVVRVSGPDAHAVCARVFRPRRGRQRDFVATLGDVIAPGGRPGAGDTTTRHDGSAAAASGPAGPEGGRSLPSPIDEALCVRFPAGRSYTGEPGFELSLHGSPVTVRAVLRALVDAGCRLAEPGELTLRAVLSGRMDLVAAEAVDDVVHAKTEAAARAALRALRGGLSARIAPVREALVDALAEIEARLDFPDEELGDARLEDLARGLGEARAATAALLAGARTGRRLREGARVVLYGPPNAGKSTLLNALLDEERALVHHEPGTTRDVLEAPFEIAGIPVTLVDVAGVRPLGDAGDVERMGIERAEGERARADVVVALVPANEPGAVDSARALGGDVVVLSKADLLKDAAAALIHARAPAGVAPGAVLRVSARTGAGLEALRGALAARLRDGGGDDDDEALLMRERQVEAVRACHDALGAGVDALAGRAAGEVVASELRRAARALDRLLGRDIDGDVLDRVFSKFCIGK